jgi:hydroxyacylglutathione hydrolase
MPSILPLPAFSDNYIWLIEQEGQALVVDPGDAAVVEAALAERRLALRGILATHHHPDHVGGAAALAAHWGVPVYGPAAEAARIGSLTHLLNDGDEIAPPGLGLRFTVLSIPGHTLGHIAFHCAVQAWLFCGDTLFAAGCGRLFEGTPEQMLASLDKLARLPPETAVYCGHEYTLGNLEFARTLEPGNPVVLAEYRRVQGLRSAGQPSLPSTLERERSTNPFLRCTLPPLATVAGRHIGRTIEDPVAVFAVLRSWKDAYRVAIK